jgi:hypothetical protein
LKVKEIPVVVEDLRKDSKIVLGKDGLRMFWQIIKKRFG